MASKMQPIEYQRSAKMTKILAKIKLSFDLYNTEMENETLKIIGYKNMENPTNIKYI